MTIVAHVYQFVVGVDTHARTHTLSILMAATGDISTKDSSQLPKLTRHRRITVIIDLTGIRDGTGPARLLDRVEGRSKQAFKSWLSERPKGRRDGVEVVATDGFTGFETAATEGLPDAVTVMDPFHVVRLAGDALDRCRRRFQ